MPVPQEVTEMLEAVLNEGLTIEGVMETMIDYLENNKKRIVKNQSKKEWEELMVKSKDKFEMICWILQPLDEDPHKNGTYNEIAAIKAFLVKKETV